MRSRGAICRYTDVFPSLSALVKCSPAALCVLLSVWCVRADEQRDVAAPRDVRFYSVNLWNAVRWSSGTNNTNGITYTVEYAIYGDAVDKATGGAGEQVKWRRVQQCHDITQTECDVTEQTNDTEEYYFGRVRANGPNVSSAWTETARFKLTDTVLGPPQLNVMLVENKLQVKLSGPFRWSKSGKTQQSMLKTSHFPQMVYNISVYNNSSKRAQYFQQVKRFLQYGPLEYNCQYCVRAEVLSLTQPLNVKSSDWSCVSTADDPFKSKLLLMTLAGFLPTAVCLFVLVAVGAFAYYYICGHQPKLPKSVKNIHHDGNMEKSLQMFQPEKHLSSINVIINSPSLSVGEWKSAAFLDSIHRAVDFPNRLVLPVVGGGYAAQDVLPEAFTATSGSEDHQSCLSDDYGLVRRESAAPTSVCVGGVVAYMTRTGTAEQQQEQQEYEEEEDETQTSVLNWDQDPGQLQLDFPLFRGFSLKNSETTETPMTETRPLLPQRPDLTSVLVKQASEETKGDDPLLKMEQLWDLQVQSIDE